MITLLLGLALAGQPPSRNAVRHAALGGVPPPVRALRVVAAPPARCEDCWLLLPGHAEVWCDNGPLLAGVAGDIVLLATMGANGSPELAHAVAFAWPVEKVAAWHRGYLVWTRPSDLQPASVYRLVWQAGASPVVEGPREWGCPHVLEAAFDGERMAALESCDETGVTLSLLEPGPDSWPRRAATVHAGRGAWLCVRGRRAWLIDDGGKAGPKERPTFPVATIDWSDPSPRWGTTNLDVVAVARELAGGDRSAGLGFELGHAMSGTVPQRDVAAAAGLIGAVMVQGHCMNVFDLGGHGPMSAVEMCATDPCAGRPRLPALGPLLHPRPLAVIDNALVAAGDGGRLVGSGLERAFGPPFMPLDYDYPYLFLSSMTGLTVVDLRGLPSPEVRRYPALNGGFAVVDGTHGIAELNSADWVSFDVRDGVVANIHPMIAPVLAGDGSGAIIACKGREFLALATGGHVSLLWWGGETFVSAATVALGSASRPLQAFTPVSLRQPSDTTIEVTGFEGSDPSSWLIDLSQPFFPKVTPAPSAAIENEWNGSPGMGKSFGWVRSPEGLLFDRELRSSSPAPALLHTLAGWVLRRAPAPPYAER